MSECAVILSSGSQTSCDEGGGRWTADEKEGEPETKRKNIHTPRKSRKHKEEKKDTIFTEERCKRHRALLFEMSTSAVISIYAIVRQTYAVIPSQSKGLKRRKQLIAFICDVFQVKVPID